MGVIENWRKKLPPNGQCTKKNDEKPIDLTGIQFSDKPKWQHANPNMNSSKVLLTSPFPASSESIMLMDAVHKHLIQEKHVQPCFDMLLTMVWKLSNQKCVQGQCFWFCSMLYIHLRTKMSVRSHTPIGLLSHHHCNVQICFSSLGRFSVLATAFWIKIVVYCILELKFSFAC